MTTQADIDAALAKVRARGLIAVRSITQPDFLIVRENGNYALATYLHHKDVDEYLTTTH